MVSASRTEEIGTPDAPNGAAGASGAGTDRNTKSNTIAHTRRDFDAAIVQGGAAEHSKATMLVEKVIEGAVADILFIEANNVLPSKLTVDHGPDTLVATELLRWFIQTLGVDLGTTELLDQTTTISQIATNIAERAPRRGASTSRSLRVVHGPLAI
ncbi:hypothetical protein F5B17DRAFT_432022 [Nemania serpens]|nr:hypothetical protein F5B17DRAFT_432022 [Nemania serpens]